MTVGCNAESVLGEYTRIESQDDTPAKPSSPGRKASLTAITANLITAGLGTGILSLPWATAGASLLPSVAMTAGVMALNAATVTILILAAERWQAFDLGALLSHLPGRYSFLAQVFVNVLTWVSVFLCLVGYIVVIADSLEPLVMMGLGMKQEGAEAQQAFSGRPLLMAVGACAVLPLCFLDQERLSFSSGLGIVVNIYMFILVAVLFARNGVASQVCVVGAGPGAVTLFSTLMQCAIIQMVVPPMYEELKDRSPGRFNGAVIVAFGFLAVLFAAFAAVAYLAFGPDVQSNVMLNFPDDAFGNVARVGMAVTVLAVYPLVLNSMVAPVRHWEASRCGGKPWRWRWAAALVVCLSAVGGAFAGELGTLQVVNGAMQVSAFIAVAPGLAGLFLLGLSGLRWQVTMYALVVLGLGASFLGFVYDTNEPEVLTRHCVWQT